MNFVTTQKKKTVVIVVISDPKLRLDHKQV